MESQRVLKLLKERYFLEGEDTWTDIAKRVSGIYTPIFEAINNKEFLPSTPTLMNANTKGTKKGTLSSCFTMDINDSIDDIFDALKEGAIVTKASGGVGYVFSKLRSSKEGIKTLMNRPSSGPIPFMRMFNSMLDGIQQGGVRRGAGMAQFDITHPNILDVIRLKNTKGEMERLNVSVRVTDEFYLKLKENPDYYHIVHDIDGNPFRLEDDDGKYVTVKKLWDEIIEYAWKCAEPGIFNSDIAYRQCTVTNLNPYVLSNPCAEFTNIPYASCNLGSINLIKFVVNGKFDWDAFDKAVRTATHFLNNVIDVNEFPLEKIKDVTLKVRPIGLGAMGYAHMLYVMNIPFNSQEANTLCNLIFEKLTMTSMSESCLIARDTGFAYPAFDYDLFMKANERFFRDGRYSGLAADIKAYGVANSCFTSIAPNGSIGYIANTTGGIEPVFALTYSRKIEKLNKEYEVVYISDPVFDAYLKNNFNEKTQLKILAQVAEDKGSCQKVKEISEEMRKVFVVASDLTPMEHLESLAIVARNTSLSVSKCISKDSLIYTEKGLQFIKDISDNRIEDTFSNITENITNLFSKSEKATGFYYNGVKPCKKITLSNGIQFTATNTHRILLDNGILMVDNWEEMKNLEIGNKIK
jgi:ribonucleoside-diphosphate reductase alpha chain